MKRPSIKIWRRSLQIVVAAAFVLIPYLNRLRIDAFSGNFLSFNAMGLPLADPLAALQVMMKTRAMVSDLLIGGGITLLLAFCLGTVFCSWICPFGLLSEIAFELRRGISHMGWSGLRTKDNGFPIKAYVFGFGLLGTLLFSPTPVLNQLSMPGWYSRLFQLHFNQAHLSWALFFILMVLALEGVVQNRLWCRYICPQAVFLVLVKILNPFRLRIAFNREKCLCRGGEDPCQTACSLGLDPKALPRFMETACTNCGDCVVACKKRGNALGFQVG